MNTRYGGECPDLVAEYLQYLEVERGYSGQTIYGYFMDLRIFCRFILAFRLDLSLKSLDGFDYSEMDLADFQALTRGELSAFFAWLAEEKSAKERTRNRKLAVVKSFYGYLWEMDYVEKNILHQIPRAKTGKNLPHYLGEGQGESLLWEVNGVHWLRDRAIILLMMSAGLRVSEVSGLNLADFRVETLMVMGKGRKERQVYLTSLTQEALAEYLEIRPNVAEDAFFLSQRKGRISVRAIQKMTKKYLEQADLAGYSCHSLRHTAATKLLKSGANLREIQEILGHESVSTTEIYTHVSNDDLRRAVERLDL